MESVTFINVNEKKKKRILLTHAYGPKLIYGGRESIFASYSHRFTKGQDIFRRSRQVHMESLHMLAQNVQIPATVLEFSCLDDFKKEIAKNYDFLGINHFIVGTERVLEMCRLTRQISPKTKIILGGYGVVTLPEIFKNEKEQRELIDYVCYSEGVYFLRSLLGEKTDRPMEQRFPGGNVLVGLGCVRKCDFCCTSSFYKGKHIQVASAPEIYKYLKISHNYLKGESQILYDDNLFSFRSLVDELGKLIREDNDLGLKYLGYQATTTIDSIATYSDEELILSGLDSVFLGVESLYSNFNKGRGINIKETFQRLHNCGIKTSGSMIIGLDCQTPENIRRDIDHYISLGSTVNQITSVVPIPGTSLWKRYKKEQRLLLDLPWEKYNKDEYISAKNFTQDEVREIIDSVWRKAYLTWGHTLMRILQVSINGYCYCKESKNRYLREDKSFFHESRAKKLYTFIKACSLYSPNDHVRKLIKDIKQRYVQVFGKPNKKQMIASDLLVGYYSLKKIKHVLFGEDIITHKLQKYYYPNDGRFFNGRPYRLSYPNALLRKIFKK